MGDESCPGQPTLTWKRVGLAITSSTELVARQMLLALKEAGWQEASLGEVGWGARAPAA